MSLRTYPVTIHVPFFHSFGPNGNSPGDLDQRRRELEGCDHRSALEEIELDTIHRHSDLGRNNLPIFVEAMKELARTVRDEGVQKALATVYQALLGETVVQEMILRGDTDVVARSKSTRRGTFGKTDVTPEGAQLAYKYWQEKATKLLHNPPMLVA